MWNVQLVNLNIVEEQTMLKDISVNYGQLVHEKQFWGHLSKQDSVGQSGFLQACDGAAWIKAMWYEGNCRDPCKWQSEKVLWEKQT